MLLRTATTTRTKALQTVYRETGIQVICWKPRRRIWLARLKDRGGKQQAGRCAGAWSDRPAAAGQE